MGAVRIWHGDQFVVNPNLVAPQVEPSLASFRGLVGRGAQDKMRVVSPMVDADSDWGSPSHSSSWTLSFWEDHLMVNEYFGLVLASPLRN